MRALTCLFAAVTLTVAAGCRGGESEQPPIHLVPNMDTQEKGRPYRKDTTGLFADGRTMRPPVPGTVAVGQLNDDDVLHLGLDESGNPTLKFPDAVKVDGKLTDALRTRGESRYVAFCSPCHGLDGEGKGTVVQRGYPIPPPNLHDARLKDMPAGKLYAAIANGVNNGNMASYAAQIPVKDRWAVVAYLRKLQQSKDPSVRDEGGEVVVVAAASASSAEHGEQLYKAKGCNACHTIDGTRTVGPSFKGLWGKTEKTSGGEVLVDEAYLKESIEAPMAKVVEGYPPAMPPSVLTDIELGSLALYLQTLK